MAMAEVDTASALAAVCWDADVARAFLRIVSTSLLDIWKVEQWRFTVSVVRVSDPPSSA